MYPNLYYVFKDLFGVKWDSLKFANSFGLMVAVSFIVAAIVLNKELQRKEKQGLLTPREEMITVGKPASMLELFINGFIGFVFGYKLLGLFFDKPANLNAQEYIFSGSGNILGGLAVGAVLVYLKWRDKDKQKLKEPERRNVRIWPHDRVGDLVILGLVFGIIGAKLFDSLENWNEFVKNPWERLVANSGLTFYGGLICAAIAICWYASKKGIKIIHLVDAAAPALMIAYGIGRIGCQIAGDGDWGVYNSAYVSDASGHVRLAQPAEYERQLQANSTYYLNGFVHELDTQGHDTMTYIPGARTYANLQEVPHRSFVAPSFLPTWMVAYTYPMNVNKDGVKIPGCNEEHCRALPQPVFPTPFYETVLCLIIFLFLWNFRKRMTTPGMMFGVYLIFTGLERFFVELIRVNSSYTIFGLHPSQAEVISTLLVVSGLAFIIISKRRAATSS